MGTGMNLHQSRFAVGAFGVDARTGAILDQAQRAAAIQAGIERQSSRLTTLRAQPILAA